MARRSDTKPGAVAIRAFILSLVRAAAVSAALWSALPAAARADGTEIDELDGEQAVSQAVIDVAGWAIATGDHGDLPFAIVDKHAAQILVFDASGKLRGMAPVLIGSATGDHSAPGVGDRELSDIPLGDRTTPAGRFFAAYGPAIGGKTVLWVDYATAVSLHPVLETSRTERRRERLASPEPDDNRVTHGCINVSPAFYRQVVRPVLRKQAIFYVLPDVMSVREALPGFTPPRRRR